LGYVYVGGRGARNAPITPGVVQGDFKGQWHGGLHQSDMKACVFKLSPDGSRLVWAGNGLELAFVVTSGSP